MLGLATSLGEVTPWGRIRRIRNCMCKLTRYRWPIPHTFRLPVRLPGGLPTASPHSTALLLVPGRVGSVGADFTSGRQSAAQP